MIDESLMGNSSSSLGENMYVFVGLLMKTGDGKSIMYIYL